MAHQQQHLHTPTCPTHGYLLDSSYTRHPADRQSPGQLTRHIPGPAALPPSSLPLRHQARRQRTQAVRRVWLIILSKPQAAPGVVTSYFLTFLYTPA